MSELLGTFSPEQMTVVLSVGNITHVINGYADGTFLNINRMIPASTLYSGADNTKGRVKRSNRDTEITLTLHQFATSNAILQELQRADENDSRNRYVFNITIKDNSGTGVWSSRQAFISSIPQTGFGTEAQNRDWLITAISLDSHIGANTEFDAAEVAVMNTLGVDLPISWQLQ